MAPPRFLFVREGIKSSVPFATASKKVATDRNLLRKRVQTLQSLKQHVDATADVFNASQLVAFAKAYKDINNGRAVKLPKTNSEKLALLESLIQRTNIKFDNKQAELDALTTCRLNKPSPISLEHDVVVLNSNGVNYVVLVLFVPDNLNGGASSSASYCVRRNLDPAGSSSQQYFTKQPCDSIPSCPQVVPHGELADIIYEARNVGTGDIDSTVNEVNSRATGGYTALSGGNCSAF